MAFNASPEVTILLRSQSALSENEISFSRRTGKQSGDETRRAAAGMERTVRTCNIPCDRIACDSRKDRSPPFDSRRTSINTATLLEIR
jgi:hypothetical protein